MSYLIKWSLIIPQALESRLTKTFFGILQHDWADSNQECVSESQLMHPEIVEQKTDHPSVISSPWGQLLRAWCSNTKKACWFNLFARLFVRLAKSQMTSLAALRHAEFALNGGSIYIISCNSQNDWFPWGNCLIFMPSLECN